MKTILTLCLALATLVSSAQVVPIVRNKFTTNNSTASVVINADILDATINSNKLDTATKNLLMGGTNQAYVAADLVVSNAVVSRVNGRGTNATFYMDSGTWFLANPDTGTHMLGYDGSAWFGDTEALVSEVPYTNTVGIGGPGQYLTALNGDNISSGTVAMERLPAGVVTNGGGIFSSRTNYTDRVEATNSSTLTLYGGNVELALESGQVKVRDPYYFSGKGTGLTDVPLATRADTLTALGFSTNITFKNFWIMDDAGVGTETSFTQDTNGTLNITADSGINIQSATNRFSGDVSIGGKLYGSGVISNTQIADLTIETNKLSAEAYAALVGGGTGGTTYSNLTETGNTLNVASNLTAKTFTNAGVFYSGGAMTVGGTGVRITTPGSGYFSQGLYIGNAANISTYGATPGMFALNASPTATLRVDYNSVSGAGGILASNITGSGTITATNGFASGTWTNIVWTPSNAPTAGQVWTATDDIGHAAWSNAASGSSIFETNAAAASSYSNNYNIAVASLAAPTGSISGTLSANSIRSSTLSNTVAYFNSTGNLIGSNITSGAGSQTPILSDIDAGGFDIYEAATIYGSSNTTALTLRSPDGNNEILLYDLAGGLGIRYNADQHEFTGAVIMNDASLTTTNLTVSGSGLSTLAVGAAASGSTNLAEFTYGGSKVWELGTNGLVYNKAAAYQGYQLYGTNIVLSPTNGNLQLLTLTNATTITLVAGFTNLVETIRLDISGSNQVSMVPGNISNATVVATSGNRSAFLFDKAAAVAANNPGGTNWYITKLYSY